MRILRTPDDAIDGLADKALIDGASEEVTRP